jgi:hypothetical protein
VECRRKLGLCKRCRAELTIMSHGQQGTGSPSLIPGTQMSHSNGIWGHEHHQQMLFQANEQPGESTTARGEDTCPSTHPQSIRLFSIQPPLLTATISCNVRLLAASLCAFHQTSIMHDVANSNWEASSPWRCHQNRRDYNTTLTHTLTHSLLQHS